MAGLFAALALMDLSALPVLRCPFLLLSGLPCPLCGMTRAMHAWMHGDAAGAMAFHALSPAAMGALAALGLGIRVPGWSWSVLGAAMVVFGIFRIAIATL